MATYVKFQNFVRDLGDKVHDLQATGDTLKVYLTNTAPTVATDEVKASLAGITEGAGFGYDPADIQNDWTEADGTATLTGTDVTWTASGGDFGPFRYVVIYNDTPTSPADPLICYWDYGSSITITDGNEFTVDFGASIFTLA